MKVDVLGLRIYISTYIFNIHGWVHISWLHRLSVCGFIGLKSYICRSGGFLGLGVLRRSFFEFI